MGEVEKDLRVRRGNPQKCLGCSSWFAATLLPVLECASRHSQQVREVLL